MKLSSRDGSVLSSMLFPAIPAESGANCNVTDSTCSWATSRGCRPQPTSPLGSINGERARYAQNLPDKQRGQKGCRAPYQGRPMKSEHALLDAFETLRKARFFGRAQKQIHPRNPPRAKIVAAFLAV